MDSVFIQPVGWERPYLDQYEAVRRDLEERGISVRIVEPAPMIEERAGTTYYNMEMLMATPEVVIYVAEQLAEHGLDIVEGALLAYLIGKVRPGPSTECRDERRFWGRMGTSCERFACRLATKRLTMRTERTPPEQQAKSMIASR